MCSNVFTMFAGFCGHADKNPIYTVLTVTTGPLRANIRADMALHENEFDNLLQCSRMSEDRD